MGGFGKVTKVARSLVSTELYTSVKQSTTAKAVIITHRVLGVTGHSTFSLGCQPYLCIAIIAQQHEGTYVGGRGW